MNKASLKIACVENMNNNMFAIMRHLRNLGYDAELIISREFSHFKPEADTFGNDYRDHVIESDFIKTDFLYTDKRALNKFFSKYNFVIACGYSIAYLTYAKIKIDVVVPYGSDLYDLPFHSPNNDNVYTNRQRAALAYYQKKGIENADAIIFDYTNEEFEKIFKKFYLKGIRYKYTCPFIFTPEFNPSNTEKLRDKSANAKTMFALREKFDFIALSQIRQSWKNPIDIWSYKGNEKVIKAFKRFKENDCEKSCLILFEYGSDVADSKNLIRELSLEQNVVWFPVTARREILTMITYVDAGIGETGNNSWFSYGAIFEILCMKKPVIHFRDDDLYRGKVESMYPMYSAKNEEQVYNSLVQCYTQKESTAKMAAEAHEWYIQYAIEKPLGILTKAMESKSSFSQWLNVKVVKLDLFTEALVFYFRLKFKLA